MSTYSDLIRPMQITMDTFAQQLHNAKRTVHAKFTYLRDVVMRRPCMVSSPQEAESFYRYKSCKNMLYKGGTLIANSLHPT